VPEAYGVNEHKVLVDRTQHSMRGVLKHAVSLSKSQLLAEVCHHGINRRRLPIRILDKPLTNIIDSIGIFRISPPWLHESLDRLARIPMFSAARGELGKVFELILKRLLFHHQASEPRIRRAVESQSKHAPLKL
jgi:hypothetical protein